jgi:hypothetical protein
MNFKNWFIFSENNEKNKKVAFADVKFNTIDKYYIDMNATKKITWNIEDLEIGEKIADLVQFSNVPYWKVINIDEENNKVFLEPIAPNPYMPNAEGKVIGAGGHEFNQHDFDILGGDYERERIDQILGIIKNKEYKDISDIKYILLGTVPLQVGPNGSQGGWYNCNDAHNRGFAKGMEPEDIMKKDAETLKNKLHFSIPPNALNGTLSVSVWNNFVDGGWESHEKLHQSKLPEEDFEDPHKMSEIILSHQQPAIRNRNAQMLIYKHSNDEKFDELIKHTAIELGNQPAHGADSAIRTMFINVSKNKKWDDVLDVYQRSPNPETRDDVARAYRSHENFEKLLDMMKTETHPKPLREIISALYEMAFDDIYIKFNLPFASDEEIKRHIEKKPLCKKIVNIVCRYKSKLERIANVDDDYYANQLELTLKPFIKVCNLI